MMVFWQQDWICHRPSGSSLISLAMSCPPGGHVPCRKFIAEYEMVSLAPHQSQGRWGLLVGLLGSHASALAYKESWVSNFMSFCFLVVRWASQIKIYKDENSSNVGRENRCDELKMPIPP